MGHDKLRKFAENQTFECLFQPSAKDLLGQGGYFDLQDYELKGSWAEKAFPKRTTPAKGIILELGCGKGEYTLELARRNPDYNFIGVDIKGARLWRGAKTATAESLPNVAFLRTRIEFLTALFAPGEISEIWLTFSDPQMKSENSRLSSPLFLERYRKILCAGGTVHLKTDSQFLHNYTKAVCTVNDLKVYHCTADLYGTPDANIPAIVKEVHTFYENMFLEMGLPITYLSFCIDRQGEYLHPGEELFNEKQQREAEGNRRSFNHTPSKKQ